MSHYFEIIGVSSYDDKHFSEVANREQIRMINIEMTRSFSPLKDIIALYRMSIFFLNEKPSIVHSHTPKAGLIAMVSAWITRVPVRLHTLAGMPLMEAKGLKKFILKFIEKITCSCAHRIYPNSLGLHNYVIENKLCSSRKIQVLGNGSTNGINVNHFDPEKVFEDDEKRNSFRESLNISSEDFIFCFVGRIVKDKGIKELVKAFEQMKSLSTKSSKLLLVGPIGNDRDSLGEDVEVFLSSCPDIILAGRHDDIRPFLAISDVFVFPSYREGFPNVVLQAGAMGLPCIVSDINGNNEIIVPGSNGILVPPKMISPLKEAMLLLISDNNMRIELANQAREMIVSRYLQNPLWKLLLKEYQSLLAKKGN